MNLDHNINLIVMAGGILSFIFGIIAERSRYCAMGAVSDWLVVGDATRMRVVVWAMVVAMLGMSAMQLIIAFPVDKTLYAANQWPWLAQLVGGVCFGVGMTLASGCAARNLVRCGNGNLKALVVLMVTAIAAYATMKGILSVPRLWLEHASIVLPSAQDLPSLLASGFGLARTPTLIALTALVFIAGGWFSWRGEGFRAPRYWLSATAIGLLVVSGWWVTGHFGFVAEHPETLEEAFLATQSKRPESFSMLAPLAYGLELIMLWSDKSRVLTFGIATAIGMFLGAGLSAWQGKRFRWEGFKKTDDLVRHMVGGVLMGFGGVCAVGCTIGQGLSGMSTLSIGSMLATLSIMLGCFFTLKLMLRD